MTEEEKERLEDLENLLPCILYYHRTEQKDDDDNDETMTRRSYSLYDGFDKEHRSLSLRLHQQECSICLMEYEDGEKLTSSHNLNCLHAFHRDCMKKWLVSNSECPCCRKGFLEFGDNDEGADDNEIDTISPLIASRFALLATTFQQQVGRMRQDIENQLEPIILRLEQQHQNETIDPPNANHHQQRRTTRNDTATQYDESSPYATGSSSIIQQRMERIREGLSDQFVNMMVRIEQNGNARRGAGDDNSGAGDDTSWRN
ncbi:unnamed protein product [Cylindrotheca closterium]|uniref:RING-type domain-containing protein n=1 Tax=Cylindrotheca closterium TaxID=2856 RepID=A0AAD2JMI7_9STRA|nr:unnamed protein product [Cylindrotheca closterium]